MATPARAEKRIIAAAELSSLFISPTETNNHMPSGVYYEVLKQILHETKLDDNYELIIFPMARAKKGFLNEQYACYSPGIESFTNPNVELEGLYILSSEPLNRAIVRIISRPSESLFRNINDITSDDSFSIVRGVPVNALIMAMLNRAGAVFEVSSELENIRMLIHKRVRWSISYYPDVIDAYKELKLEQHFPYATEFSPFIVMDNIICHQSDHQAFYLINNKLIEMKKSGALKEILGEMYMADSKHMQLKPRVDIEQITN